MRAISPELQAHLASGVTSLCHCWRLLRRDGTVLGFTDHDNDLSFDGLAYAAGTGFSGSEMVAEAGLAAGGGDVSGALSASCLTDADILAGRYDGARIETWLVNWQDVSERLLLDVATIGEIIRQDGAFKVELRGMAAAYDQEKGRIYAASCSAEFGDARCSINIAGTPHRVATTIASVEAPGRFTVSGLSFAAGQLTHGLANFTTGAAAGLRAGIREHGIDGASHRITIAKHPELVLAAGDQVILIAGCDKRFATCRDRFANTLNFRGFPHLPSTEQVLTYVEPGRGRHDGGSFFR